MRQRCMLHLFHLESELAFNLTRGQNSGGCYGYWDSLEWQGGSRVYIEFLLRMERFCPFQLDGKEIVIAIMVQLDSSDIWLKIAFATGWDRSCWYIRRDCPQWWGRIKAMFASISEDGMHCLENSGKLFVLSSCEDFAWWIHTSI